MTSFEDNIHSRVESSIQQQKARAAELAQERQSEQDAINAVIAERERSWERIRELGQSAARVLISNDIPTLPIWDDRAYGKRRRVHHRSLSGGFTTMERPQSLQETGRGWHLIKSVSPADYDRPKNTTNYGLSTAGEFFRFHDTKLAGYEDPRTQQRTDIEGIIHPVKERYPGDIRRLMESDLFMDAVAFMSATGRTYKN